MTSVEDRIVAMKFDNKQFQPAAEQTLSTLDRIKQALGFKGGDKGLTDVQAAANKFNMGNMDGQVNGVSKTFLAMSAVAITALANITNRAVDAGINIAKAFTLDPLEDGFAEYELQINSTKTILSNVAQSGAGLKDVEKALDNLNEYADLTIYNFGQMTDSIGKFTAAGVDLDTATASIKGIANMAALGGASATDASRAMYQLSQAISAGKINLMDWKSVENANMATSQFKDALTQTAVAMGTLDKSLVKNEGKMKNVTINGQSFRESIMSKPGEESWLTSDVLTSTLEVLTGDLSNAELAARGYTKEQIKSIQLTAKMGVESATQIRTFSGLMDTLKEGVGSGWATTWRHVFGGLNQATKLWTGVSNTIGSFVDSTSDARNKVLKDWKQLGGRKDLIEGLKNIWEGLVSVMKPVRDAFRDIFPPTTGKKLADITKSFRELTEGFKIGAETSENLKRTFRGLFAVFSIGWQILKGIFGVFGQLFGLAGEGTKGLLSFTGSIGDFLVKIDEALKKGDGLTKFFDGLADVLKVPLGIMIAVGKAIGAMFGFIDESAADAFANSMGRLRERLGPISGLVDGIINAFQAMGNFFAPLTKEISGYFKDLWGNLAAGISSGDFSAIFDMINAGLFGGILLIVRRFMSDGLSVDIGGGLLSKITESFGALTGTLEAMQTQIKAKSLMMIAGAIGILTLSLIALSVIDSAALTKSLVAVGAGLGMLVGSMQVLSTINGLSGANLVLLGLAFGALGAGVLILSFAIRNLSGLDWDELAKGLAGVGGLLVGLSGSVKLMSGVSGGLVRAGIAMIPMAVALVIMSTAVKKFADISWDEMVRGMVGITTALTIMSGAINTMPASTALVGPGLVAAAGALVIMGEAVKSFAGMSWEEIGRGMAAMAGALAAITLALIGIPPSVVLIGPGLIAVSAALLGFTKVLQAMAGMGWSDIGKSMVVLAGSLAILSGGLMAMTGTTAGVAALLVAATAIAILAPALVALGGMSWEEIGKGLLTLVGVFTVLGVAGFVLAPIAPIITALGLALLGLGAGMLMAGMGAMAFATAFTVLAAAGTAGVTVLTAMVMAIIGLIPAALTSLAQGIIAFAATIASGAPQFAAAFTVIIGAGLDAVIKLTPKFGKAIRVLLNEALRTIRSLFPKWVTAGLDMIGVFLQAVVDRIPRLATIAADGIAAFIRSVGKQAKKLSDAGFDALLDFIEGISKSIDENAAEVGEAAAGLGAALAKGMGEGIRAFAGEILDALSGALGKAWKYVKKALGINSPSKEYYEVGKFMMQGQAGGIRDHGEDMAREAERASINALDRSRSALRNLSELIQSDIDSHPTIKPVLDLTNIQNGSSAIAALMAGSTLSTSLSVGRANSVEEERRIAREIARENALVESKRNNDPSEIIFEQNNYSPEALSDATIYRNTRNLLAMAREALVE